MTNIDLKDLVRNDLVELNEKERLKRVKENKKLKKITIYTSPNYPQSESYKKHFTSEGIRFIEKDATKTENQIALNTVQIAAYPILYVNENYLVQGREFTNASQAVKALQHFARPNFVNPPAEERLIETIKNLQMNMGKYFSNISRQLQPIVKIMNEIAKEEKENNEKKNK
tara:strand:+ start:38 stop:550 length:513 start_codon:yes stop_codon:yes gene_type:complete